MSKKIYYLHPQDYTDTGVNFVMRSLYRLLSFTSENICVQKFLKYTLKTLTSKEVKHFLNLNKLTNLLTNHLHMVLIRKITFTIDYDPYR